MKRIIYLLFISVLFITACGDDEVVSPSESVLNLDGDNETAPILPEDIYEAAAQFSANEVAPFAGQELKEVEVYLYDSPLSTTLKIYGPGNGDGPGDLLYEAALTGNINNNDWTSHTLSQPLMLTGEELWLSVELRHTRRLQSIGCDEGPNVRGGDWLFQASDGIWRPFNVRYGESINWNIRGIIE